MPKNILATSSKILKKTLYKSPKGGVSGKKSGSWPECYASKTSGRDSGAVTCIDPEVTRQKSFLSRVYRILMEELLEMRKSVIKMRIGGGPSERDGSLRVFTSGPHSN